MALSKKQWKKIFRDMPVRGYDELADKAKTIDLINSLAENGKIAIVNGGMDCDHSKWDGAVSIVSANWYTVQSWLNDFYNNAEGPQYHDFESPSIARGIESTSRDLILEAFEDGHAHTVYV